MTAHGISNNNSIENIEGLEHCDIHDGLLKPQNIKSSVKDDMKEMEYMQKVSHTMGKYEPDKITIVYTGVTYQSNDTELKNPEFDGAQEIRAINLSDKEANKIIQEELTKAGFVLTPVENN